MRLQDGGHLSRRDAPDVRAPGRDDDGQRDGIRERHDGHDDGGYPPADLHGAGLVPLGPEEVEEEGGAEDGGDRDADEDVVRLDADEVVVVDRGAVDPRDVLLLADVICF